MQKTISVISAILFLCAVTGFSARYDSIKDPEFIIIRIEARTSTIRPYWVNIYRTKSEIKIVYAVRKEIYYTLLSEDKDYLIHQKTIQSDSTIKHWTKHQLDSATKKLTSIIEKYTVYDKDSLLVKRRSIMPFDSILMSVYSASLSELENKDGNKNRFLLDGTHFKFIITSKSGHKEVYAHSPNQSSNPLLYIFLTETFNVCRNINKNSFLDKRTTTGY